MGKPGKSSSNAGQEILKSEMNNNITLGVGFVVFFIGLLIWPIMQWLAFILAPLGALVIIYAMINMKKKEKFKGTDVPCPYCGHTYKLPFGIKKFECPLCKGKAVMDGEKVYKVPD